MIYQHEQSIHPEEMRRDPRIVDYVSRSVREKMIRTLSDQISDGKIYSVRVDIKEEENQHWFRVIRCRLDIREIQTMELRIAPRFDLMPMLALAPTAVAEIRRRAWRAVKPRWNRVRSFVARVRAETAWKW